MTSVRTFKVVLYAFDLIEELINTINICRLLRPAEMIVLTNDPLQIKTIQNTGLPIRIIEQSIGNRPTALPGGFQLEADVILYIQPSIPIDHSLLKKLVDPVLYGTADASFLDEELPRGSHIYPKIERAWAVFINYLLDRPDLKASSLYDLPFVLSNTAARLIGNDLKNNPALANIKIVGSGRRVVSRTVISDGLANSSFDPDWYSGLPAEVTRYERLVIQDYLYALKALTLAQTRKYTDGQRRRDIVRQVIEGKRNLSMQLGAKQRFSKWYGGKTLSVIIPARNEARTITAVLQKLQQLKPTEVIVVDNGSSDRTAELALKCGANVISIPEQLGTDCGRAIGAIYAKGDILLFIDGDIVFTASELFPFAMAISRGYDVALNDRNDLLESYRTSPIISGIYALNAALGYKSLGASSMTYVPFALSRKALKHIGPETLQCPPASLSKCLLQGFKPVLAARIVLEKRNKLRSNKHITHTGLPLAGGQIVGDHLEALQVVIQTKKTRL